MSACVFVLSNHIKFANIDQLITSHLFFPCPFSFFSMKFTFDTAWGFPVVLRDGGGPPVGGMEHFAGFFNECWESEEDRVNSRWGEGMSKFLARGGTYVRHSRHVISYQNMFKNYLYEKILP